MSHAEIEQKLMDLDRRVDTVEQILPTLLRRSEFEIAMEAIHRHFDVVAESLRGDIRLIAEGHAYLVGRFEGVDRRLDGVDQRLDRVDQRLDRIDGRLDGIDQRLDRVDQRLDGIDQWLGSIDRRLDGIERQPRRRR